MDPGPQGVGVARQWWRATLNWYDFSSRRFHMDRQIPDLRLIKIFVGLCLLSLSPALRAHTEGVGAGGFFSGVMHPISGLDHVLAMVAVGIWGAALGRPLLWALPVTFPLLMVGGGVLGIAGVPLPFVEHGIAASVVVLGLAILAAWRAPVPIALAVVGFFGVLHGYAHGLELPESAAPAQYAAGFVISTGLLHLTGIALGALHNLPKGREVLRAGGAAIAAAGVWILSGMPGVV